jgi:hypothetical protein
MSNLTFIIIILVFSGTINAQEIRVIDNKGTIKTIRNNNVFNETTDPVLNTSNNIIEGDVWFDESTAPKTTKIWNGTIWITIESSNSTIYTGSFIITGPGGTANQSFDQIISGLPFLPSQITFVALPNIEDLSTDDDNGNTANTATLQNTFGSMKGFVRGDGSTNFLQNVIFIGGSGSSINDISRYSSDSECIGLRYTNKEAEKMGLISASLTSFDTNIGNFGFTLNVNYIIGNSVTGSGSSFDIADRNNDVFDEDLVVLYTAYK